MEAERAAAKPTLGRSSRQRKATTPQEAATWPLSTKLLPIPFILLALFFNIYYQHFIAEQDVEIISRETCRASFSHAYRINAVRHQAEHLSTRSWELGSAVEAIEELLNPEKTVFGRTPFPHGRVPKQNFPMDSALLWIYQKIRHEEPAKTLFEDAAADGGVNVSATDAAALGVAATMVGQRWEIFLDAADRQKGYLLDEVPRYGNGAISSQVEELELRAEAMGRFAPFLAYQGVARNDTVGIMEAIRQIGLYRRELLIGTGEKKGLWRHVVGAGGVGDEGAWSTGNALAAYAMARVRATITGWPSTNETMLNERDELDLWIQEILDAVIATDDDNSKLLRNYLGDDSWFGETSGTALMAATAYRMAVLNPEIFAQRKYLTWASEKRRAVTSLVDEDGFAPPVVHSLKHDERKPAQRSAEGASHLIMMASAWRDCVCARVCSSGA